MSFLPAKNPLVQELKKLDMDALTPLEALNKLYEWQQRFRDSEESEADG
jgi:DNA mismatch repair protein MutS